MSCPRVEIDLDAIGHNARTLVDRAAGLGISVTGVTKALLGLPPLATVLVGAGVSALGDSRIDNIERMRDAGCDGPMVLLRSPMPSQVTRVVASGATSLNADGDVLSLLADAARAAGVIHDVILMVELGDLREGVMPDEVDAMVDHILALACRAGAPGADRRGGLRLRGVGANLACRSGVAPDDTNMARLSACAGRIEDRTGVALAVVSGGNSANLLWAFGGGDRGRVNNLRLGESILLGCEPLQRQPIAGLRGDAVALVAEVIESARKPRRPWGRVEQTAFGPAGPTEPDDDRAEADNGPVWQTILALGHQDTDPDGLTPPPGVRIVGASSDHLVTETDHRLPAGTAVRFRPGYGALLRAMTSPFVATELSSSPDNEGHYARPR